MQTISESFTKLYKEIISLSSGIMKAINRNLVVPAIKKYADDQGNCQTVRLSGCDRQPALHDKPYVKPATRTKVERIARENGYRAHRLAKSLVTGRTNTIGLVVLDIQNPFFVQLISLFHEALLQKLLETTAHSTRSHVQLARRRIFVCRGKRTKRHEPGCGVWQIMKILFI